MTVSEAPGRTIGPGLLLDESANNGMLPPGAISSAVTVTLCPSPNIGLRGDTSGAPGLAAVWAGGTTAGAAGATAVAGEVVGAKGAGAWAWVFGLGAACGAGAGGAMGAGVAGFGLMVTGGGGVLSPK